MKNNTDKPMHDPEYPDEPLMPGHVRYYEFLHGYEDVTLEEDERRSNDPLYTLLVDEIRKEIDREIIATICTNARAK